MNGAWDFSLANYGEVWSLLVNVGIILLFLLLGNILRNVIPFLRKSFIPAALIGGLLLFIVNIIWRAAFPNTELINTRVMQVITYHALAVGFIAMTIKTTKKDKGVSTIKVLQNGALTGGTYMIQAFVGILTILIFVWAGYKFSDGQGIFYDTGIILPLAFGQGPGNAMTWDINFAEYGFDGNGSFGLTLASVGFLVASIVGVIYINIFRRKGEIVHKNVTVSRRVEEFVEENEIEDSESVDKFSIQLCLVFLAYALAFGIMCLLSLNNFTNSLAWGFNFIFGVITATLVKVVIQFFERKKIIKRKYINNYQMDRISGFAFDLMIISGVAAIDVNVVTKYIGFIILLSVVGAIVTIAYVKFVTKLCYKGYEHEMFLVNFGTLTGTASNGMILLREIDPAYQTPASSLFVLSQFPAMVMVAPLLLLINFSAKSITNTYIALAIFGVLAIAYTTFIVISAKKMAMKVNATKAK